MAFLKQSVSKNVVFRSMSTCSKLFVGGHELSLKEAFSQYGEAVEARVILERETSSEALDSQDLHGRQIRVNFATERPRTGGYGGSGGGSYQAGGGGYNPASQQPPPQSGGNSNYTSGGGGGGGGGTGANPLGGFASPLADFDPTKGDFHVDTTSGLGEIPSGPRPLADGKSDDYNDILLDNMVDESDNYNDIIQKEIAAEVDKANARFMDQMVNESEMVDKSDDYDDIPWSEIEGDVWTTLMIANLPPENEGGY